MFWLVEFICAGHYVRITSAGKFTLKDHLRMIEDIVLKDFWKPGISVLFDNRNLEFDGDGAEMMRAARDNHLKYDDRVGDGKIALLMKSTPDYIRGRQYELLAEGKVSAKVRVFKYENEAIRWLLD